MAVLLAGSSDAPKFISCQTVLLSDPKIPQSKQPYHAALELPETEGKLATRKLRDVVRCAAKKSIDTLLKEAAALQYGVRGAALVVGSLIDPATLHNKHIRAHGLEGQLFRTVLEETFRARKISCEAFLEKGAYETAAGMLRRAPAQIKRAVAGLGESHEGSWRAEEKLAALAAWMALHAGSKTAV
jgi:hypothetical protein